MLDGVELRRARRRDPRHRRACSAPAAPKSSRRSSASSAGRRGGAIRLDGEPVDIRSPRDARRLGLALVTEDRKAKGLHLARLDPRQRRAALAVGASRASASAPSRGEAGWRATRCSGSAIRCTGIDQIAGTLSGGNQQKVVIGKWLATRPRVLLLDEPTRGIDVGAKQEIYELIFGRCAAEGLAIVMVSSELPELLLLADRILVDVARAGRRGMLARAEASEEAHHAARRAATRADAPGVA